MEQILKFILQTEKIDREIILMYCFKLFYQKFILPKSSDYELLFIVGCQRSGTSLMNRIFSRDLNVKVYRESGQLSSLDRQEKLRLKPFPEIHRLCAKNNAPLSIIKALVETQNIVNILDYFPNSKAIWMYRNYKDVINSSLKKFGTHVGIRDIKYIVDNNQQNWRSEKVSESTRSIISQHFAPDMNPYDAAALFWFARNQLFYDLKLDSNPRVFMCQYQDLVKNPREMMNNIYHFLNLTYQNDDLVKEVHCQSLHKGSTIQISPSINHLCNELLQRLNQTNLKLKVGNFN